ncbi:MULTISPECIES: hypothetical protein [unclassified Xanthomonas]|nr:hypothetical protein [Xanthomonas sp. LMG 8992]
MPAASEGNPTSQKQQQPQQPKQQQQQQQVKAAAKSMRNRYDKQCTT